MPYILRAPPGPFTPGYNSYMRVRPSTLIASMLLPLVAWPQTEFIGTIRPRLAVNPVGGQTEPLKPASPRERNEVPSLPVDAKVFTGDTFFRRNSPVRLALVESPADPPLLYADVDLNGRWEPNERYQFLPSPNDANAVGDVLLELPLTGAPFSHYPIRLRLLREPAGDGRMLLRSPFAYVEGLADVAGQHTRVWYAYRLDRNDAYPDFGWQGMDVNGDGKIQTGGNSIEYTNARDERVIFRVNGRDVSTKSLDLQARKFVLRVHPSGDNQRITLAAGETLPDFEFTTFDGAVKRIRDYRGGYLLVDIWGMWCAPCRADMPHLQNAAVKFRNRKLSIVGLNTDEEEAIARKGIQELGLTFPQATYTSVKPVIEKRLRIDMYPTTFLLDSAGKIIVIGEDLRRLKLDKTLDAALPK